MNNKRIFIGEKLGECGVDSGQIMLCDPCYLDEHWKKTKDLPFDEHQQHAGEFSYYGACVATDSIKLGGGQCGLGVATRTAYGDGCYPVHRLVNSRGDFVGVAIFFDDFGEDDETEEAE